MYHLLMNPNHSFPTILSPNSEHYPTYIDMGYEKINEGSYKEMEAMQKIMIEEYLKTLTDENN